MNQIGKFIALAFLMFAGLSAYANGDPVVKYSSIERVANPEPLTISEIRIVHEQLNITHTDGYNCFDVTYRFKNESGKDFPEIHYGFPVDYLVADEKEIYQFTGDYYTESIHEIGWNDRLIKDIAFTFNGKELSCHSARESVREAGFKVEIYGDNNEFSDSIPIEAINRRWFYTKFAMGPHAEASLNVRYKVYAGSLVGLYSDSRFSYFTRTAESPDEYIYNNAFANRYFADRFDILYDFTPAKHFGGGRPYVLDVDINLENIKNPYVRLDDYYCFVNRLERNIYVDAQDIKPIDITVYFQSDRSPANVNRIIERFMIPRSEYDVSFAADSVRIDFKKPVFVSELACDIDTAMVKSLSAIVTYCDDRQKRYKYVHNRLASGDDLSVNSPILLTVTDLRHDGMPWSETDCNHVNLTACFDDDSFKIRAITLVPDKATSSDIVSVIGNIRALDARFDKKKPKQK